ncbi:unnamed protein product [Arabidopsis halleri]
MQISTFHSPVRSFLQSKQNSYCKDVNGKLCFYHRLREPYVQCPKTVDLQAKKKYINRGVGVKGGILRVCRESQVQSIRTLQASNIPSTYIS